MNIFLARVYVKFWFLAPKAHTAANNDLFLLQQLHVYPQHDIASATLRRIAGQLWYLSEDLILLSLFDLDVDVSTKRAMLNASKKNEGDELDLSAASLKKAVVDLSIAQQMTLVDFVSKRSRDVFYKTRCAKWISRRRFRRVEQQR